ncbi:MAG: cysteinyl-tRNA synthetase [Chloroflexota bacterium]
MSTGTLALFGSGETSSQGRKIHDYLMSRLGVSPVHVAMLETPAGFQPNADAVYRKIGEFMEKSLQNFHPQVEYVQAHKKGSAFDPDNPEIAAVLTGADYIFSGPGSPTYAARNLQSTLALDCITTAFHDGATIALSSAAAIAAGSSVMRVYEVFKAGADLGWDNGLHLLRLLGLDIDPVIVTHWNNSEGGAGLDTTHCYVGQERFDLLLGMLPNSAPILGIDEHTACILEPNSDTFRVMGAGSITIINGSTTTVVPSGGTFPLHLLRGFIAA